ncbi:hypothetical protein OQB17_004424 [Salmonella enterica]|nr:hypothetical protein [Salmonella enterica]
MRTNVADLIMKLMEDSGLSDLVDTDLDDHSTITFYMKDNLPPVNILNDDNDEVWLWVVLGNFKINSLIYYSSEILPVILMRDEEIFILGQPCLYLQDDVLYLRAKIKEENLCSGEKFINCLDAFLMLVQKYIAVLI